MHTPSGPAPRPAPLLVTIDQAGALLGGVSRSKLYQHLRDGSLKSVSIGRRRFVRTADLEQFVRELQAA